jgi:hypothetical protein
MPKAINAIPSALPGVVAKQGAWDCVERLGLGNTVGIPMGLKTKRVKKRPERGEEIGFFTNSLGGV